MRSARQTVMDILGLETEPEKPSYRPNDTVSPRFSTPYPPDLDDLERLYTTIRLRRVTTILEFGSGYSTAVMAAALAENEKEFGGEQAFKALRRNNPSELHAVDCSAEWLETTRSRVKPQHQRHCFFHPTDTVIGTFDDRLCHYYTNLPNVCPDLIYLDGPFQFDVQGEINGLHFRHEDRTVISADIARMEWLLLPGCYIIVDGRTNNARFLKANMQREWEYRHDESADVHIFELVEPPLGLLNRRQLEFMHRPQRLLESVSM